ncbi:arginine deiminase family protein [uncultured Umboniibacter sp.]|uniref:dimethylarginine dimethylaminohydrolase family protein n=1 Tax=uncultured Umboniibacter sp. TaxID=1798917 RepID=UPI002631523F|nr:arginine deiminase family protein [uncultured Umboniibacter sp.]
MFKQAIVRKPSRSISEGLTGASLGTPNYDNAVVQHQAYVSTLNALGLSVTQLPALNELADATFVEDVALLVDDVAVLTRPGAASREPEVAFMKDTINQLFSEVHTIVAPGTLEAGDIMRVERKLYVGLSARTNEAGVAQLSAIFAPYGVEVISVEMAEMLHLKTGVNYLSNNQMLVCGEFVNHPAFSQYECFEIPIGEEYAANSLWINGTVIVPSGFDKTAKLVEQLGYPVVRVDTSEFRKIDGGLSCLSLRF